MFNREDHQPWNKVAYKLVFEAARKLRIGVEKAKSIAEDAVRIAGPGDGHNNVSYRIIEARNSRDRNVVDGFICYETVKLDAHSQSEERITYISEKDVTALRKLIKKSFPLDPRLTSLHKVWQVKPDYKFSAREVVKAMASAKMLPARFKYEGFFGAENRQRYYFPLYLYPARVLDFLGYIRFGNTSWRVK